MANANESKRIPAITAELIPGIEGQPPIGLRVSAPSLNQTLSLYPDKLEGHIVAHAVLHGLKQKLVDAAAISRNAETGRSATVADKWDAIWEVYQRITGAYGDASWNAPREGGGSGSLLYKALCRMYSDRQPDAVKTWLDAKTDAEKAALRKNPKVAAFILEIQAEQAKADGIDSDALLASMPD